MSDFFAGLLGATLAILALGTYMVPLKRHPRLSSWDFLMHMAWGAFLCSAVAAWWVGWQPFYWTGVLCGLAWTLGAGSIFSAVQKEEAMGGVTVRAMGTSITVAFLMGVLYFHEPVEWPLALPALALLFAGLLILNPQALRNPRHNWRSYVAGFVFGCYLAPWNVEIHGVVRFMLPLTIGIVIGSTFFYLLGRKGASRATVLESAGMGGVWAVGNTGCFVAVERLGFTIGYPLTQLNLLVAIAWGIAAFGEYPTHPERRRVAGSAACMIAGGVLLSLARG